MKKVIAALARNSVFANILMVGFLFAGFAAGMMMVREIFPEFDLDVINVSVAYPGADPEEAEEGISRRIEEAIDGLEGIREYSTQSMENRAAARIEIVEGYDVRKAKDEIKNRIDAITTFPVDAERPIISEATIRREVLVMALSGPLDERRLKEWAEEIRDEIRALPDVSQADVTGTREYEISIEVSEERLREHGLTFSAVADAVRRSNLNLSGGMLRTEGEEIRLRTIGRRYWGDEFENIVVLARPEGQIITLGQLATVRDGFMEDNMISWLDGEPVVLIQVFKTPDEDSIVISNRVREYIDERMKSLPPGYAMTITSDSSDVIQARIRLLQKNGIIGMIIVWLLLWIFLDLRLSFWAGMGIPISLSGGLAILWFTGGTLNMISMFGLIMVLGIVVDDAIVVGEAIYVRRKKGDPPMLAAVNGTMEVGLPVIAAVLTTVLAFIPLMFIAGVMGNFIRLMPVVVIGALLVSLVECLVMLPSHLSHLPDPNDPELLRKQKRNPVRRARVAISNGFEWLIDHAYGPLVQRVIGVRYVVVAIAISLMLVTFGMFRAGFIRYVMFPPMDGDNLTASVEFPDGTPIDVTHNAVDRLEESIHRLAGNTDTQTGQPLIKSVYSLVGASMGRRGSTAGGGSHLGAVRVEMLESQNRGIHSRQLTSQWEREIGDIPGVVSLNVEGQQRGPSGKPIEVWIKGQDMEFILAAAEDLMVYLGEFDGVSQIESDFRPGKNEITFELKPEAHALGLTVRDLARQVQAGFFGEEALRVQRGRDDIRVRVRYPLEDRRQLAELEQVRIRTPQGLEVPLTSVAEFNYGPGYATITRMNGQRRVIVSADIDFEVTTASEIVQDLQSGAVSGSDSPGSAARRGFLGELEARYPMLSFEVAGEQRDSMESLAALAVGFPLALIAIFAIIATIFRSYSQPVIIMITVPFGLIGAVIGHMVMGFPMTMMSVFGIVALSGVVVNDAIVLIECINNMIADDMPFFKALKEGGVRRFRAIFLTTASTVGGLAPMLFETDRQARFLIPMAISIAAGVIFATLLTLFLIPCLLGILNDLRRVRVWLWTGIMPDPEEVEPARTRKKDLLELSPPVGHLEPVAK